MRTSEFLNPIVPPTTPRGYCEEQMKTRYLWKCFMNTTRPDILTYSCALHPLCRGSCALPLGPLTSELELPRHMPPSAPQLTSLLDTQVEVRRHFLEKGVQSVLASVFHPRSSQLAFLSETVYVFAGLLPLLHKKRRLQDLICLVHSYVPCV